MKKIYTLASLLFVLQISFAQTTFTVHVSNYQFNPSTVNAHVGDKIKWVWDNGFHTTTSTGVPSGADTWNAPLQTTGASFTYTLSVAGNYTYECSVHPTLMQGTITVTGTLPVVLNGFNVISAKTNTALVSWSTASEINTDHFEIMRSTDDKSFVKIGNVAAAGNSSSIHNYSYTDNAVPNNTRFIYYYLSVVDKDGKKTFSNIQMFANINSVPRLIVSLSPNPITRPGHLMLQFNAEKAGAMHVQLYNASGKLIKEDDLSAIEGLNNGHFHIGDVTAGVYTVIFSMNGRKESYKIVVE